MNVVFSLALNNTNKPSRFRTIGLIFQDLRVALQELGHECAIVANPASVHPHLKGYSTIEKVESIDQIIEKCGFTPDVAIIWNGSSTGDVELSKIYRDAGVKIIFGELGFFNHYGKTCYFDSNGSILRMSDITKPITLLNDEGVKYYDSKVQEHIKPRLVEEPYIFVPLQDEYDTQVISYSPFKKMEDFLDYVEDLFRYDSRPIIVKKHPRANIPLRDRFKFQIVTEDVHHYIPYADFVVGINSTVLVETLLYHSRIITAGAGIASRKFTTEEERMAFIVGLYKKQFSWDNLKKSDFIKQTEFYKDVFEDKNEWY